MKEVVILLAKMRSEMPKVKVSNLPKKKPKLILRKETPPIETEEPELQISEAERLEQELQEIEAKLGGL